MRIARAVSSFSLLLIGAACLATDYGQLAGQLKSARSDAAKTRALTAAHIEPNTDPELASAAKAAIESGDSEQLADVQKMVQRRAALGVSAESPAIAARQAAAIKSSRVYVDPGVQDESNWLRGAWQRLAKLFERDDSTPPPEHRGGGNFAGLGKVLLVLAWTLLGGLILLFAYFVFRRVNFARKLMRKSSAMLGDDEPERTLDEWLAMADQLIAEGKYREAVRCLYLACLLKFDEHNIARFVRGETNWEHLRRIEGCPRLPAGLDFLSPTKRFDTIWYGMKTRGAEDVEQFREWYQGVSARLAEAPR